MRQELSRIYFHGNAQRFISQIAKSQYSVAIRHFQLIITVYIRHSSSRTPFVLIKNVYPG